MCRCDRHIGFLTSGLYTDVSTGCLFVEGSRGTIGSRKGTDPRGYPIGGEDADYGNLLTALGEFLRNIDEMIPVK